MGVVCKHCLEEKVPDAKYESLEEYTKGQVEARKSAAEWDKQPFDIEKVTEKFIESMKSTWGRPEEDVPPERTIDELEIMLSEGKCTIAYANATKDVRAMCRLCTNETCPGPYLLGEWEDSGDDETAWEVKKAMDLAKKTKPKRLKISSNGHVLGDGALQGTDSLISYTPHLSVRTPGLNQNPGFHSSWPRQSPHVAKQKDSTQLTFEEDSPDLARLGSNNNPSSMLSILLFFFFFSSPP